MATELNKQTGRGISGWRIVGWSIPALLLLLPLVAMQFTSEVNWTASDFVFAAVVFGTVGLAYECVVRTSANVAYRVGAAVALFAAFATVWVNAAVGMIGSEDNPFNLLFGGVLAVALIGSIVARFRPGGMMWAMIAAGFVQAVLGAIGFSLDSRGGVFSLLLVGPWLLAALLLRSAARDPAVIA